MNLKNYNKDDMQFIVEAYKNGMLVREIEDKLKKLGRLSLRGKPYTKGCISNIAIANGLRRNQIVKKGKNRLAKKVIKFEETIKYIPKRKSRLTDIEDLISSNLSEESKIKFLRYLSQEL